MLAGSPVLDFHLIVLRVWGRAASAEAGSALSLDRRGLWVCLLLITGRCKMQLAPGPHVLISAWKSIPGQPIDKEPEGARGQRQQGEAIRGWDSRQAPAAGPHYRTEGPSKPLQIEQGWASGKASP
ncbi:hypothetical protein NDU88_000731 [Pleurodeles waltl]|uniref:Uncharacterized protein n=1 Tax=Pleurodeles waltl TaxID=8319 RepID=A0AAV7KNF8_PLEWA|nr:hypothetical protein NDU88_000731 [Pleurodeles waltl]